MSMNTDKLPRIVCSQCEYELPQYLFSATQLAHLNDALDTQGTKVLHGKGDFSVKCYQCVEAGQRTEFKCRFCNEWLPGWHFARSQHAHAFQQSHSLPVSRPFVLIQGLLELTLRYSGLHGLPGQEFRQCWPWPGDDAQLACTAGGTRGGGAGYGFVISHGAPKVAEFDSGLG